MATKISPKQFHDSPGVEDWRAVFDGARTVFVTGSFARGVELVAEIGRLADAADHHPDVDLSYGTVGVHLFTHSVNWLSDRDAALAAQISAAAAALGIRADPARVQKIGIALDTTDISAIMPFWRAVLAYQDAGDADGSTAHDPTGRQPHLWLQETDSPATSRFHLDVSVPADQAEARIKAAVDAGGRVVSDANAPAWWLLADPQGNLVDVASWPDTVDETS